MIYSLDLLFKKPDGNKGDLPGSPIAQIYVKAHSVSEEGHILITPHCVSFSNVDHEINRLIRELEEIRKKAKRKFQE